MTARLLIINADDFGFTAATTAGILQLMQAGVVTSTSVMVNTPHSAAAMALARQHRLDVGWHITLTQGQPVAPPTTIPSLVTREGALYPLPTFIRRALLRQIRCADVERELFAQWEILRTGCGAPSHLNGHHHVHVLPVVRDVVKALVRAHQIPWVRLPFEHGGSTTPRMTARSFLALQRAAHPRFWRGTGARFLPFYGLSLEPQGDQLHAWKRLCSRLTAPAEIMVHPAERALADDDFSGNRRGEWQLLMSPAWRTLMTNHGFRFVSFRALTASRGGV